jgi:hypothetical protein
VSGVACSRVLGLRTVEASMMSNPGFPGIRSAVAGAV